MTILLRLVATAGVALLAGGALAEQKKSPSKITTQQIEAVLKAAFPRAPADWAGRVAQDETLKACSEHRNKPPSAVVDAILARERATIKYPSNGNFLGDWRRGEEIAQSGYGLRFTDDPAKGANGGNCYACHKLTEAEVSYGTLGVSLYQYGKLRRFGQPFAKAVYEKIYNSHAAQPCSQMPRFGANGILSVEQITDLVALLMDPDSPVNK